MRDQESEPPRETEAKSEDLRPDFSVVLESLRLDVQQIVKNQRANNEKLEKFRDWMMRESAEFKAEIASTYQH
jgi:hypothetical protein